MLLPSFNENIYKSTMTAVKNMGSVLKGKKQLFFVMLYLSDVVSYLLSALVSAVLVLPDADNPFYIRFFLFTLSILIMNFMSFQLYKDKRSLFNDNDFMKILYAVFVSVFIVLVFILMFDPANIHLYFAALLSLVLAIAFITVSRWILYRIIFVFRKLGYDRKKVLLFGSLNGELANKIKNNKSLGYQLVKTTKNMKDLEEYIPKVDIIFLTNDQLSEELMRFVIEHDEVTWKIVPSVLNLVLEPVTFDEFRDYPIIKVAGRTNAVSYNFFKRVMDLILSSISIIGLFVPYLIVAAIIKITMPGPVFFMQERIGTDSKPFMVYKFRSMCVGADKMKTKLTKKNEVKGLFKMKKDPRVTKFGSFLRRTCIDELPQLINIFKGEMSLVGPRPHLRSELKYFKGWRMSRFKVKPGLTGMWQVNGRHELNFDKAVLYDVYYIRNMSFKLDIQIILKTIPAILMTRGRY